MELFAWTVAYMHGTELEFMSHCLSIFPDVRLVAQKRRKMSSEKAQEVWKQVQALLDAGFIREVTYPTWLSNMMMAKMSNGKWRMCVDYTDLNKACPKDSYPLPSIDELVDTASCFRFLSFLDACSGYNQMPMYPLDEEKTTFITPNGKLLL